MRKYEVKYRNKTHRYNGASCMEVAEKFGNRKVFGNPAVFRMRLRQCDADTCGKKWAIYEADGERVEIDAVED